LELVVEALSGDTDEFRRLWIAVRNAADQAVTTAAGNSVGYVSREVDFAGGVPSEAATDVDDLRSGVPKTPWTGDALRVRLLTAEPILAKRVVGQSNAIRRVIDVLIRSVVIDEVGFRGHKRPRLVLFFAGPVGVGKLELAKALAVLLFGGEDSYVRFRMGEFSAAHSEDRLFGAPLGSVGYETGGELANCIRRQPFRVVVFDEIEKAHPRILDRLLLAIEDGELVDHDGPVSVADSVMIFTTSLGVTARDPITGQQIVVVTSENTYAEIEDRSREVIASYFRDELGRYELFYQLENGLVIFDFIRSDAAAESINRIIENYSKIIQDKLGLTLELSEGATKYLYELVGHDLNRGGRAIALTIERVLLNPLARDLIEHPRNPGQRLRVLGIREVDRGWQLEIE
jgi:ATP-dependent Clp protease ATP-binding subunit ClpB